MQSTIRKVSYFVVAGVILLFQPVYASESTEPEVTIDSPAEVIAEDFVLVAVVPKPWVYRLWSWLGTDQVDVRNLTDKDFEKYIQDEVKRKQVKQIYEEFKKLDTFKKGDQLEKWEYPVYIRPATHPVIDDQIKKVLLKLKNIPGLNISYPKSVKEIMDPNWTLTEEEWQKSSLISPMVGAITIATFGEKKEADSCLECIDEIGRKYTTLLFRTNDQYVNLKDDSSPSQALKTIQEYGYESWDRINAFTDIPSFSPKHGGALSYEYAARGIMFHVEGDLQRFKFDKPEHKKFDGSRSAQCKIYFFHPEKIIRALTTECILRSLGLLHLSNNSQTNLGPRADTLEEVRWITEPTEYDLLLLKILYDNRIKQGMTRTEVLSIATEIIKSINGIKEMNDD
jgi:hypothetical protein